jgi:hypothetical protein
MPGKKSKTAADRPPYRPSLTVPVALPEQLEPFSAGFQLGRIVTQIGVDNVRLVLDALAEQERRELIERRASETRDLWKQNMKPMAAATIVVPPTLATSDDRRRTPRYRRHRQESVDAVIQQQERDRELEAGLAVILERKEKIPGHRAQVTEVVDRIEAGQAVALIAEEMGLSPSTVERRLADVREVAEHPVGQGE